MAICYLSFNVLNQYSIHSYNHIGTYSEIFSKNKRGAEFLYYLPGKTSSQNVRVSCEFVSHTVPFVFEEGIQFNSLALRDL